LQCEELLGTGGYSSVFAATDGALAEVAIKISHSADARVAARFAREAEVLASLAGTVSPRFYRAGSLRDGRSFLVMERMRAPTLAALLAERSEPFGKEAARALGLAILDALAPVHAAGVVHRDLKPENIFVRDAHTDAPRVSICDFGLAAVESGGETSPNAWLGTPEYAAPEQRGGGAKVDARADLYSFGIILFELLTLRVPFASTDLSSEWAHRALAAPRPSEVVAVPAVPAALDDLVASCLAKHPPLRPVDVGDARDLLRRALESDEPVAEAETTTVASAKTLDDRFQAVALLAVPEEALACGLDDVLRHHGGFLARHATEVVVCAFLQGDSRDPADSALAAAERLAAADLRVVMHVATAQVHRRPGRPPAIFGDVVSTPAAWMPAGSEAGLSTTVEAEAALARGRLRQSVLRASPEESVKHVVDDIDACIGREAEIARLLEAMATSVAEHRPVLVTLTGLAGVGKTRLLQEIAARASADSTVVRIAGGAPDAREMLLERLQEHAPELGSDEATLADRLRRAAQVRPLSLHVDDADMADGRLLEAIEYATLEGGNAPICVIVAGRPRLQSARGRWGARAARHVVIALDGLDRESAVTLAAALVQPAEYPPRFALERLADWSGGNPLVLAELVRALKLARVIRASPITGAWMIASEELGRLSASTAGQWLAAQELESVPPEVATLARLAAIIAPCGRRDLAAIQRDLRRRGVEHMNVDVDFGVAELTRRGLLVPDATQVRFRDGLSQTSIGELVAPADRRLLHAAALRHHARIATNREAIARHAEAAGETSIAASMYVELGERAVATCRAFEADAFFNAALALPIEATDRTRVLALLGRGRMRYRFARGDDALVDLREAAALSSVAGARDLEAIARLEEATALDWLYRYAESSAVAEEAARLVEALDDARLSNRAALALGRRAWRLERIHEAIEMLDGATAVATRLEDDETRIIGLLLLACALTWAHRPDEAEARFAELFAVCERTGDVIHRSVGYGNRCFLWLARDDFASAMLDLRRSMEIARDVGNPLLERNASVNLAEILYMRGEDEAALKLAERASELYRRFAASPVTDEALLLARIHLSLGNRDGARAMVAWVREHCPSEQVGPSAAVFLEVVDCVLERANDARWDALIERAAGCLPPEQAEVLCWRVATALEVEDHATAKVAFEALEAAATKAPILLPRVRALRVRYAVASQKKESGSC
jgi:tetratricopeptide (TPR) repeat protein